MNADQYLIFRDVVDSIEKTYVEFRREGDRKDRRDSRIIFYDAMRRIFVEDPLGDEELQSEVLTYLEDKVNSAADGYTDWIKKVFIQESLKKRWSK